MNMRCKHSLPIIALCAVLAAFLLTVTEHSRAQVPSDREALLNGSGSGQGSFAEQHGYPGPRHVLDFAKELQLTEDQTKAVQKIFDEMKDRAKELGQTIINVEEELDAAFKDELVTDKSIREDTEEIGRMRGKLRAVHLIAHLKTQKVLTPRQISEYKKLRAAAGDQPKKK